MKIRVVFIAVLIVVAVMIALQNCRKEAERVQRFESGRWKAAVEQDEISVRRAMLADLLDRYNLKGMSLEEAVQLLGPPERSESGPEGYLSYAIGLEEGYLALDHEWLFLKLRNKVVDQVSVIPD